MDKLDKLLELSKKREALQRELDEIESELKAIVVPVLEALKSLGGVFGSAHIECDGCGTPIVVRSAVCADCSPVDDPAAVSNGEVDHLGFIEDMVDNEEIMEQWVCDFLGCSRDKWKDADRADLARCAGRIGADVEEGQT